MMLGPIALPQLGIVVSRPAGRSALRSRLVTVWGSSERAVRHATPYALLQVRSWVHVALWALRLEVGLQGRYSLRLEARAAMPYRDLSMARTAFRAAYRSTWPVSIQHAAPYADRPRLRRLWRSHYHLTADNRSKFSLSYALSERDPVRSGLRLPWSLLAGQRLQPVANAPELTWRGRRIRILSARLSGDEESPYWLARVEVAHGADFAAIAIGDTITLDLGLERFVFVVDGKSLSRVSMAEQHTELSGISPLALQDAPFATAMSFTRLEALSAQTAVEQLLGAVEWRLPAWTIPAGRLQMENVTPLSAARRIVEAIGGLIESRPDGAVICRPRHPVNVPAYATAAADHLLDDGEILSAGVQAAPHQGFNRVTLANEADAATYTADRVEVAVIPDEPHRRTVRAYLGHSRPVRLAHTGHPATAIQAHGAVRRQERETVEFVEGGASVRYPVAELLVTTWRHTDLGPVAAAGTTLRSASAGYSLLDVTYVTTALEWTVSLAADEEVQFVLIDI